MQNWSVITISLIREVVFACEAILIVSLIFFNVLIIIGKYGIVIDAFFIVKSNSCYLT
jgi:hypothetical protein